MKLPLIEFPMSMFTLSEGGRRASSEASDMGNRHLQRLYDDACDVGFVMEMPNGKKITFVMSEVIYHGEGEDREIGGWKYVPTSESIRQMPNCAEVGVTVFND